MKVNPFISFQLLQRYSDRQNNKQKNAKSRAKWMLDVITATEQSNTHVEEAAMLRD